MTPSQVMGNACGAGSSGAVREQRAKEGSAEQMCKRRGSSVITDRKIKRHDVRQDYDLGKLLGEGAFGKVHAGTLKRSESEKAPVATTEGGASPCPEEKCERAIKFLGVAALKATGVDDDVPTSPGHVSTTTRVRRPSSGVLATSGRLYHWVSFRLTPEAPADAIVARLLALDSLECVRTIHFGTNCSPEGKARGHTHGCLVTFNDVSDRDAYLVDPEHVAFTGPARA